MVWWLYHERNVTVSQSTVSRLLKRENWSRKNLRRISQARSLRALLHREDSPLLAQKRPFGFIHEVKG
jgi:arginine repressor